MSRYTTRRFEIDNGLPVNQSKTDTCVISTLWSVRGGMTFVKAAVKILGLDVGVNRTFIRYDADLVGINMALLGRALIERGHTMTLVQAEEMFNKTEDGEKTGMCTNGYEHFFFAETENEHSPVSIVGISGDGHNWHAAMCSFGDKRRAVHLLLLRNLDASKL